MKKTVFVLFVDLSVAFDHIVRSSLFKSIYQRLAPKIILFFEFSKLYTPIQQKLYQKHQKIFLSYLPE